jgi:carbon monoxide dehydrogenase subunit G
VSPGVETARGGSEVKKLSSEIRVNAPKEKVWKVVADFPGISKWAPPVLRSVSTSDAERGVGAGRHCDLVGDVPLEEHVTDWEEGRGYSYVVEGIPQIKSMHNGTFVSADGDAAVVTQTMEFEAQGSEEERTAIEGQLNQAIGMLLAGLKHYVETGQPMPMPSQS